MMISVAWRNPTAVSCCSGAKTTDATSDAWKSPSENWLTSRIPTSFLKSRLDRAPRMRSRVPGPVATEPSGYPSRVMSFGVYASADWTSKNRVQSWSSAWPLPRMKLSTMSCAAGSENCTGGDFMK